MKPRQRPAPTRAHPAETAAGPADGAAGRERRGLVHGARRHPQRGQATPDRVDRRGLGRTRQRAAERRSTASLLPAAAGRPRAVSAQLRADRGQHAGAALYAHAGKAGGAGDCWRTWGASWAPRRRFTSTLPIPTESRSHSPNNSTHLATRRWPCAATAKRQVEAYNCVFHALAKAHPDVCRFDLAFMEAATGRPIQHMECLLRGGQACRFRIGSADEPKS